MKRSKLQFGMGIARSVAGASHLREGRACDDAVLLDQADGAWLLTLADGAGSASRGEMGAHIAARAGMTWLQQNPVALGEQKWRHHLQRGMGTVRKQIVAEARRQRRPLQDFATTLLLAVIRPTGVLGVQIGDGAFVVETGEGELETLFRERKLGPSNVAAFLTQENYLTATRFHRWPEEVHGFLAFSDGLEGLGLDGNGKPFAPFARPLLQFIGETSKREARKAVREFLSSERIRAATDDDVTLALGVFEVQHERRVTAVEKSQNIYPPKLASLAKRR